MSDGSERAPAEPTAVRLGWWLSSEEHDPRVIVQHARMAEDAGFTTATISDHLQPWVRHQGNAAHVWTVIGTIAAATERIEVGTGVTAMLRRTDPITVAQAAATAAVLLEGRFFLGVGTGERLNEQPYGRRWPGADERRERLREAIVVLHGLWSGESVNHRGEHWTVENLRLHTRPASTPPIYVAASGKRSAALAGEIADGLIGVTPDSHAVEVFRGAGGEGKPCLGKVTLSLAATMDEAVANACTWWPNALVPPPLLTELARPSDFEAVAAAANAASITDSVICTTDAEPIVAAIDRYVGAGYSTLYLHQVGPDQGRLASLARDELLAHYRR